MKPITVLSLFDGMSCGQIALERVGIPVKKYYASEIDKYAIKVTQCHYPDTIQLGDINNWKEWDIETPDLIIAGSPCQGFSNAGHGLNFEDPRSKLFFTFCKILAHYHPKNPNLKYMLENVKMKKEWKDVITDYMKVEPVLINSALLSAQNRQRLYWANWDIPQPEDKGIFLKDIVESGEVDRDKSYTVDANYFKGGSPKYLERTYHGKAKRQVVFEHQSHKRAMVRENGSIEVENIYKSGGIAGRIYSVEGKSPTLRTPTGGNHMPKILIVPESTKKGYAEIQAGECVDLGANGSKTRRGKRMIKKVNALSTNHNINYFNGFTYRKLTPVECERLQTVEDNWTSMVSNTQRYKMLGNGWTIDVIAHILNHVGF